MGEKRRAGTGAARRPAARKAAISMAANAPVRTPAEPAAKKKAAKSSPAKATAGPAAKAPARTDEGTGHRSPRRAGRRRC